MNETHGQPASRNVVPASPGDVSRVLLWLLAAGAMAHIVYRLVRAQGIGFLNYNEGWNAYHALRYVTTGTPYPPADALVMNNYPPLWFPIVAFVGRFTQTYIEAGRVIATAGLAVVLFALAAIGRELRGTTGALAAFAIGAYLFGAQAASYVGTADPQMLAQGIGVIALFLALRSGSTASGQYQAAIALTSLAGFVKHNLIALPLALMLAAMLDGRGALLRAMMTAAGSLVVGYLLSALVGGLGWPSHLGSAREYSLWKGFTESLRFIQPNVLGIVLAVAGIWSLPSGLVKRVLSFYLIGSLVIGVGFIGGEGVAINIFFDTMIAMTIGCVAMLGQSVHLGERRTEISFTQMLPQWALTAAIAVWLVGASAGYTRDVTIATFARMRNTEGASKAMADDIAFLRASRGNAICDKPDLCFRAGKSFIYDPFNAGQAILTGRLSADDVRAQLTAADVQVIHVSGPPSLTDSVPSPIAPEVAREFVIGRTNSNGTFLVRKPKSASTPVDSGADGF